jgi:membrane protease YdiL (CAAX protease family)
VSTTNNQIPVAPPEEEAGQPPSFAEMPEALPTRLETPSKSGAWLDLLAAIGLWFLSIIALAIVPSLLALPYILYRYWGAANIVQLMAADQTAIFLSVFGVIPAHFLTLAAAWLLVTQRGRRPFWHSLGWSFSKGFGFWACAGIAIALYLAGAVIAWKVGKGATTDIETLVLNSSLATRITLALLATFTGPLVEEIIYRGVIYTAMEKTIGMTGAVILVSFLFTLVHVFQYRNNVGVILVVGILSVSLTLVRALTGRLLPCFIIHMVFNGVQSILIIFHPYIEQFEKSFEQKLGIVLMCQHALPFF